MAQGITLNPTAGDRIARHVARVQRLDLAITQEQARPKPRQARLKSLIAEVDRRTADLAVLGVKPTGAGT